jgi:hypothetical protein
MHSTGFKLRFWLQESLFLSILFFASSLPLQHFFLSINIGTAPRSTHPLYNYHERRVILSFSPSCPSFVLPWLTFCIIASCFHSRSNGMATDIGFMAPRGIWHILRLAIWSKELRKTWGNPWIFFSETLTFHCRFYSHCIPKHRYWFA